MGGGGGVRVWEMEEGEGVRCGGCVVSVFVEGR